MRKATRLPDFDYGTPGAYFITICTLDRKCILSKISVGEGLDPPKNVLTVCGKAVDLQIKAITQRYPNLSVDKYVIMPNHVHLLLSLHPAAGGASPSPTIIDVIRVIKSLSAKECKKQGTDGLWQRSFYDHVIRNEKDYLEIWNYIDTNPIKWQRDRLYREI